MISYGMRRYDSHYATLLYRSVGEVDGGWALGMLVWTSRSTYVVFLPFPAEYGHAATHTKTRRVRVDRVHFYHYFHKAESVFPNIHKSERSTGVSCISTVQ